jgi:hypothetical protein
MDDRKNAKSTEMKRKTKMKKKGEGTHHHGGIKQHDCCWHLGIAPSDHHHHPHATVVD